MELVNQSVGMWDAPPKKKIIGKKLKYDTEITSKT